jgi:hypothetical protein
MKKNQGISYLKLLLTVFVVAHHAFLAFTPSGVGSPIHDWNRTNIFSYVTVLFDNFFMFTFFFIAGLFAMKTLVSRGKVSYLLSRLVRLGVVFVIATYTVNIVGFYLMEVFKGTDPFINFGLSNFTLYYDFVVRNFFPTQHLWFLWVLLVFNIIFVVISPLFRKEITISKLLRNNKTTFLTTMLIVGFVLYKTGTLFFGYDFVTLYGPFSAQLGRILTYLMFYLLGVILGRNGLENSFITKKYKLQYDVIILSIGLLSGLVFAFLLINSRFEVLTYVGDLLTTFSFVFITVSLVSIFVNKCNKENRFLLLMSDNAFMIYILHYGIVSALQGIFYNVDFNGFIEGVLVFVLGLGISFGISYLLRKSKIVAKIA